MQCLELLERREQNRKPSAAGHTCECRECCVQFWFPESPKGCSGTGEDSEVVKKCDKSSRGHEIKPGLEADWSRGGSSSLGVELSQGTLWWMLTA